MLLTEFPDINVLPVFLLVTHHPCVSSSLRRLPRQLRADGLINNRSQDLVLGSGPLSFGFFLDIFPLFPFFISRNPLICLFTLMGLIQSVPTLGKRKLILSSSSREAAANPGNQACFTQLQRGNITPGIFFPSSVNKISENFVLWCHFLTLCVVQTLTYGSYDLIKSTDSLPEQPQFHVLSFNVCQPSLDSGPG